MPTNQAFLLTVSALLITTSFVHVWQRLSPQDKIICRSYDRGSKNQHR